MAHWVSDSKMYKSTSIIKFQQYRDASLLNINYLPLKIPRRLSKKRKNQNKTKLRDTDNSVVITRGKGEWGEEEEGKRGDKWRWKET